MRRPQANETSVIRPAKICGKPGLPTQRLCLYLRSFYTVLEAVDVEDSGSSVTDPVLDRLGLQIEGFLSNG